MKNRLLSYGIISLVLGLTSCHTKDSVKFQFDSKKIVSGKKIAIKDIAPQLPTDWDEYDYVTIEFLSTTPQRFQLGFTTDAGYNHLRLISYVPTSWNQLTIPLSIFQRTTRCQTRYSSNFQSTENNRLDQLGRETRPFDRSRFNRHTHESPYR